MKAYGTLKIGIFSRTMSYSSGSSIPGRAIVTWTEVPRGPRSFSTTSSSLIPLADFPSIRVMMSPGRRPSRCEGVPSIAEITVRSPSTMAKEMPIPSKLPRFRSCILEFRSASR